MSREDRRPGRSRTKLARVSRTAEAIFISEGTLKWHLHNVYIQYAAERGIPAALFIIAVLALALVDLIHALGRIGPGRSDARFILNAAIASTIGAALSGIFEHNLGDTEVLTMFLVILCAGYVAAETKKAAFEEIAPVAA